MGNWTIWLDSFSVLRATDSTSARKNSFCGLVVQTVVPVWVCPCYMYICEMYPQYRKNPSNNQHLFFTNQHQLNMDILKDPYIM